MKKLLGAVLLGVFASLPAWAGLDINTATPSELESIKGIGPTKAKSIIEHRQKNGPFKSLDDLAKVKGFGKASVAKLKDQLVVGKGGQ